MASTSSSSKRKRSMMEIAASFIIRDDDKARCNIEPNGGCNYVQSKYDPGNFIRHFRLKHSELANANGLLKDYVPPPKKPRVVAKRPIAIDLQLLIEAVVRLVTDHGLPLSCFEWDGFRLLLEPICQAVGCTLNRETVKEHLRIMSQRVKEILKDEMKEKLICLKVDSASCHNRHILGVNVQYAHGEKVVIRTLGMVEVKQSQTAAFLKTKILDTLAEYNVPIENIFSVTVDNGANMVAAVKKLRQELEQALLEKLDDGNEDFEKTTDDHEPERDISAELCVEFQERINLVRCAVHTLQLSILDVVNKSHESVKGLTELARKSKHMKYQTNFDHHNATHPQIWCQTRWGGIFEMVEAFKTQRTFFEQLATQFPELDLTNHWKFIDDYYEAFKPLYICTKRMQAEHVSLPDFYMLWLRAISEVRKVTGNQFVPGLLTSLNTRLTPLRGSRAFKMALFLDPRFNYRGSKFFSPEEKMEIMGYINETWQRIRQLQSPASTSSTRNESLSESERNDDFDEYLTEMYGGSVNTDGEPSETKFLQQLQSLDLEPRQNSNYNVWDHWLRRKTTHPELYAVAMVVLSTPSNQVSVERAFSVLGLVLSNIRTKLAEDTLTNILLVKLNKALFPQAIATAYNWKEVERN